MRNRIPLILACLVIAGIGVFQLTSHPERPAPRNHAKNASAAPGASEKSTAEKPRQKNGSDWPRFLGPDRNGISPEKGLILDWAVKAPPLLWQHPLGLSFSAPVTSHGWLIAFHRIGDEAVIESLDAETGEQRWEYRYPTDYSDRYGYNNGPRSSPTIDGERIYAFGAGGRLTCLEFEDGKEVWARQINEDYHVPQNFFGVGTAPVIEGNLILLNVGAPDGGGVMAFDKTNGKLVWKTSDQGASYSTPAVGAFHGRRLAIFFTREGLLAVEPATGKQRYEYHFRSKLNESVNAAVPIIVDDLVFLSATYNTGAVLLRLEPDGLTEVWKNRRAMQNHWASSIYVDGYLYGMDGRHDYGSNMRCIDFMTGKIQWTADRGLGRASFIMADGHFISIGEHGELALIEVNPEQYVEKARLSVFNPKRPCFTPPVLSHGLLYLRNERMLLCLNLRKKG